jgi:pimeloyl-ACP methyl ester carboxylesterase
MGELQASGFIAIGADSLEYRHLGPQPVDAPTIVLLHEGLGAADLWADLPQRLQAGTGLGVLAFSRRGYGGSTPRPLLWPFAYMHEEALEQLPRVLDAVGFTSGFLVGASDGASIATIHAGSVDDPRVTAITLIAPHFIVEDATAAGAFAAKAAYEGGDLRGKLARWHRNVDVSFYGWNACWTNPAFKREWDISAFLPRIRVPVQILQGEKDEYATEEQIRIAQRLCKAPFEATLMPGIGHSIFRDAPEETARKIIDFVMRHRGR